MISVVRKDEVAVEIILDANFSSENIFRVQGFFFLFFLTLYAVNSLLHLWVTGYGISQISVSLPPFPSSLPT